MLNATSSLHPDSPLPHLVMAARMAGFNPAMEAAIQPLRLTAVPC